MKCSGLCLDETEFISYKFIVEVVFFVVEGNQDVFEFMQVRVVDNVLEVVENVVTNFKDSAINHFKITYSRLMYKLNLDVFHSRISNF